MSAANRFECMWESGLGDALDGVGRWRRLHWYFLVEMFRRELVFVSHMQTQFDVSALDYKYTKLFPLYKTSAADEFGTILSENMDIFYKWKNKFRISLKKQCGKLRNCYKGFKSCPLQRRRQKAAICGKGLTHDWQKEMIHCWRRVRPSSHWKLCVILLFRWFFLTSSLFKEDTH